MRVMVATGNVHKLRELAAILTHFEVISPADAGIEFEFEETGATFEENALGKARALLTQVRESRRHGERPMVSVDAVIADDSGICVDALGGAPGIYSARYGSPDGGRTELPATERNRLLLEAVAGADNRGAAFVCCMVAALGTDRYIVTQERWAGRLADEPSDGRGGFGYDPIFFLPGVGCTAAELSDEEKNRLSHRGRAARVLASALEAALRLPE